MTKVKEIIGNIPIYYINLNRSIDRNEYIKNIFKEHDIDIFERIEAIDGNNIDLKFYEDNKLLSSKMSVYEIGCTLSHFNAIKKAYDNNDQLALIMEDDITFDYLKCQTKTINDLTKINDDWECIQLSSTPDRYQRPTLVRKYTLLEGYAYSTTCYLINRKGMSKILDHGIKNLEAADHWIYKILKTYLIRPYFGYLVNQDSLISGTQSHILITARNYWDTFYKI